MRFKAMTLATAGLAFAVSLAVVQAAQTLTLIRVIGSFLNAAGMNGSQGRLTPVLLSLGKVFPYFCRVTRIAAT